MEILHFKHKIWLKDWFSSFPNILFIGHMWELLNRNKIMSREFNYLKLPCLKFKRGREWWAWPLESGQVTPGSLQSHAFRNKCNMHSETNVHLKLSIVLYSWARPLTSIVPLSNQKFKWVLLIYQGKPMKCLRVTHDWLHWQLPFRRSSNTPSFLCYRNQGT